MTQQLRGQGKSASLCVVRKADVYSCQSEGPRTPQHWFCRVREGNSLYGPRSQPCTRLDPAHGWLGINHRFMGEIFEVPSFDSLPSDKQAKWGVWQDFVYSAREMPSSLLLSGPKEDLKSQGCRAFSN